MGGRVCPFGLPGNEKLYYETFDELNTDNVISFINGIMSEEEKTFPIPDNASFHKSKEFKKFAEGGRVILCSYISPRTLPS